MPASVRDLAVAHQWPRQPDLYMLYTIGPTIAMASDASASTLGMPRALLCSRVDGFAYKRPRMRCF